MDGARSRMLMVLLMVLSAGLIAGCAEDDEVGSEGPFITVAGERMDISVLFDTYGMKTIEGSNGVEYTGISLSDLINGTSVQEPWSVQFRINASDGYSKEVTWGDMLEGVLVRESTMTAFPNLPGKYRIKDVESIDPVKADTIMVNGHLFVWQQPFDIIEEKLTLEDNESNMYEGVRLSDVVNLTGISEPSSHQFNIIGAEGYNMTVRWQDMLEGILILDGRRCMFRTLEKAFWVSDIAEIEVV